MGGSDAGRVPCRNPRTTLTAGFDPPEYWEWTTEVEVEFPVLAFSAAQRARQAKSSSLESG